MTGRGMVLGHTCISVTTAKEVLSMEVHHTPWTCEERAYAYAIYTCYACSMTMSRIQLEMLMIIVVED